MSDFAKNYLEKILAEKKVPHLMLFTDEEEAKHFARKWLQSITKKRLFHFSDLHLQKPEGKSALHSIASIREMLDTIALSPYEAEGKAFILFDAERMLPASSNALLKTVEEPTPNTLIIFVSSELDKILPTIRSRAQLVRFKPKPEPVATIELPENPTTAQILQFSEMMQKRFDDRKKLMEKEGYPESEVTSRFLHDAEKLLVALSKRSQDIKMLERFSWAKLALERSTPIKNVLESLLL